MNGSPSFVGCCQEVGTVRGFFYMDVGEELGEILWVIDDGEAWPFGAWYVFAQDVFCNKVLNVANGGVSGTFSKGCPGF